MWLVQTLTLNLDIVMTDINNLVDLNNLDIKMLFDDEDNHVGYLVDGDIMLSVEEFNRMFPSEVENEASDCK